jgi:hypothetical protein
LDQLFCTIPLLQVVESQVVVGGVFSCSAESAVSLLWGLAVADALMLELWDAISVALDKPGVGLQPQQLQQVRCKAKQPDVCVPWQSHRYGAAGGCCVHA